MFIFSSIEEDTKKSSDWVEGMTADFGIKDLEYTKKKGEHDLEALEASYKILKDLENSGKIDFSCIKQILNF